MFVYHRHSRAYWFSTEEAAVAEDDTENEEPEDEGQGGGLREYHLIGVLMGLAVSNL
jgi:hypothetical protein